MKLDHPDQEGRPRKTPGTAPGKAKRALAVADPSDPLAGGTEYEIAGDRYVQAPAGLFAITTNTPMPLLPGVLTVTAARHIRDVTPECEPGPMLDSAIEVHYTPPRGQPVSFVLTGADTAEQRPQWPRQSGIWGATAKRKIPYIENGIKAIAAAWDNDNGGRRDAYACTGLLISSDGPRYLRIGAGALTPDGTDAHATVQLAPGVDRRLSHLALDDPSPAEQFPADLAALLRVLDVAPGAPVVPLAMLAQLAWAPWANRHGMVSLIIAGETGTRKSSLAGLIMSAQSRTATYGPHSEPRATAKLRHGASTAIGIDRALYPLAGSVGLVDDAFATRSTLAEQTMQWRTLSLIGDNTATQTGAAKGSREAGSLRPEEYPRACLLVTAERLPGEAEHGSEVARYVALHLPDDAVALDMLTELQAQDSTRARSRAHAAMIQHGLADLDAPARALAWAGAVVDDWGAVGHGRARIGYLTLLAGARLIADAIARAGMGDSAWFLDDAVRLFREACEAQARRAGTLGGRPVASDPAALFCRALRGMFDAQLAHAADAGLSSDGQRQPPRLAGLGGPAAVGWRQSGVLDESEARAPGDLNHRVLWFPSRSAQPIGAVAEPKGTGRPSASGYAIELHIESRRWEDVHHKLDAYAVSELGWALPGSDELLERLAHAGLLAGADPRQQRIWGARPRAYTLDLARILGYDGDDDQGDDGDPGETEPSPDGQPTEPAPVPAQHELPVMPVPYDTCPECSTPTPLSHDGHRTLCGPCTQRDLDRLAIPRPERRAVALLAQALDAGTIVPATAGDARSHELERDDLVTGGDGTAQNVSELIDPEPEPETPSDAQTTDSGPGGRATAPARRSRRKYPPAYRTGTLDVDGLRGQLGADPIPVDPLPGNIAGLVTLMDAHELRTIYVTAAAATAMGLTRRLNAKGGPDAGSPHPWAIPSEELSGLRVDPVVPGSDGTPGLAAWMTVRRDGAPARSIVFPAWEPRAGVRAGKVTGFGAAPDGAALLDAVTLFGQAVGEDYYRSPNRTAETIVKAHTRVDATCHAVRDRKVPVLESAAFDVALDTSWERPPTDAESGAGYVHRYDRNAAWMHAWGTPLGVGEPEHLAVLPGESLEYTAKTVGWWRAAACPNCQGTGTCHTRSGYGPCDCVADSALTELDALLPPFNFTRADEGGVWLSTPTIELLRETLPAWRPAFVEAYVWPDTRRALDAAGRVLRDGRRAILAGIDASHPGAQFAKLVHGSLYKSFTGYLGRNAGPRTDRATGQAWAGDTLWRPDWRFLIIETANANLYRQLRAIAAQSGRYPLAVSVDAVTYASDSADPIEGRPAGLEIGDGGREWKVEATATMADYLRERGDR
jgi:hypothetical protein